jgi:hypothetical protein
VAVRAWVIPGAATAAASLLIRLVDPAEPVNLQDHHLVTATAVTAAAAQRLKWIRMRPAHKDTYRVAVTIRHATGEPYTATDSAVIVFDFASA